MPERGGGLSRYPGVVVVEGGQYDVHEYIRRLQLLRWKQMVVRGEECKEVAVEPRGCAAGAEDWRRRFTCGFEEFGPRGCPRWPRPAGRPAWPICF